ncbi:MAG: hypothetical protein JNM17_06575 [Archangium sp.]|nr:hypothetical protein [Archangium sp.]
MTADVSSRFPMDADDEAEARRYLQNRAVQAAMDGWKSDRQYESLDWGLWGLANSPEGVPHQTFYVLKRFRGQGLAAPVLRESGLPIVTTPDCKLERFLAKHALPFQSICHFAETPEYRAIARFYGNQKAERSQIPYMNHIDEGLAILRAISASDAAKRAFCLHPIVQGDAELTANIATIDQHEGTLASSWVLATEYRRVANLSLSHRDLQRASDIELSPLKDVNDMLRADKIQNQKDFELAHEKTHPRREALKRYFELWLERLEITPETRASCRSAMEAWLPQPV